MQFGVGYMALCFLGAIAMQIVFFVLASMLGSLEAVFENPQWSTPPFLVAIPLLWGLIAGRSHDLGWPAWPTIFLFLLPWPAWLVVTDGLVGLLGGKIASAIESVVSLEALAVAMFIPVFLYLIVLIVLASVPGQARANRFGEQPLKGLWGDLGR